MSAPSPLVPSAPRPKTYRIPFRPDMLDALEKGKTATRRTNRNWLKVKEGDILLAHEGRYGKTRARLVATRDAYQQPLSEMTEGQAIDEGVMAFDMDWVCKMFPDYGLLYRTWQKERAEGLVTRPPLGPLPTGRFSALWDEINAKKPGMAWADDPSPVVLEFRREVQP